MSNTAFMDATLWQLKLQQMQFNAGRWTVTPTTTWFGASLTQTSMACYLTTSAGRAGLGMTPTTLIGSATVDATGTAQIAVTGGPVPVAPAVVTCTTGQSASVGTSVPTIR